MVFDPSASCATDVRNRAATVRLACFDVDGTLTDGRIVLDAAPPNLAWPAMPKSATSARSYASLRSNGIFRWSRCASWAMTSPTWP